MKGLRLAEPGQRLSVLCLGAHSDDIEIGVGATLLEWQTAGVRLDVLWCVLSANGPREGEARASAADFLEGAERGRIEVHHFRDGFFPAQSAEIIRTESTASGLTVIAAFSSTCVAAVTFPARCSVLVLAASTLTGFPGLRGPLPVTSILCPTCAARFWPPES